MLNSIERDARTRLPYLVCPSFSGDAPVNPAAFIETDSRPPSKGPFVSPVGALSQYGSAALLARELASSDAAGVRVFSEWLK